MAKETPFSTIPGRQSGAEFLEFAPEVPQSCPTPVINLDLPLVARATSSKEDH